MPPVSYVRHQFSPLLVQHAGWLYLRFTRQHGHDAKRAVLRDLAR
jgi:hypothetical protein